MAVFVYSLLFVYRSVNTAVRLVAVDRYTTTTTTTTTTTNNNNNNNNNNNLI